MSRVFKVMAVFLALVWVPLASHCDLEHLPGFELLACCESSHTDATPHQPNDCQTDVCASVESGDYRINEQTLCLPMPASVAVTLIVLVDMSAGPAGRSLVPTPSVPIELPPRWQFILRTALSPRAPSLVS